jgi:tetratricopeptide (TPR) repeat protein
MDALALFRQGVELTNAGKGAEAVPVLRAAVALFEREERAKALNVLGAALRLSGQFDEATATFEEAAAGLEGAERGAVLYNLGLAKRDAGDLESARDAFERARDVLDAPAIVRELGTTLLQSGDVGAAIQLLEEALRGGSNEAANPLGLAYLAAGRIDEAVYAFRRALAAHPRSIRPHEHAMAKANLALAYERSGDPYNARLAARQALGVPDAPNAVVEQARSILGRVGPGDGNLIAVLEQEPRDRWLGIVREEVVRWADAGDKRAELAEWIDRLRGREDAVDLAEAWLAALLELPPPAMEALIVAAREVTDDAWLRDVVEAASARFHTPQLLRLRSSFAWT